MDSNSLYYGDNLSPTPPAPIFRTFPKPEPDCSRHLNDAVTHSRSVPKVNCLHVYPPLKGFHRFGCAVGPWTAPLQSRLGSRRTSTQEGRPFHRGRGGLNPLRKPEL